MFSFSQTGFLLSVILQVASLNIFFTTMYLCTCSLVLVTLTCFGRTLGSKHQASHDILLHETSHNLKKEPLNYGLIWKINVNPQGISVCLFVWPSIYRLIICLSLPFFFFIIIRVHIHTDRQIDRYVGVNKTPYQRYDKKTRPSRYYTKITAVNISLY